MSREHEQLDELLAGYVDGTLSAGELAALEGYLDGHPELREQLQAMRMDSQTLAALPTMRAPSGLVETFNQKLEREALLDGPMESRGRRWMVRPTYLAAAAVLLVGVGVGVFMLDALKLRSGSGGAMSGGSSVIAFEASEDAKQVDGLSIGSRESAGESAGEVGAGAASDGIGGESTVASRAVVPAYPVPTMAAAPAGVPASAGPAAPAIVSSPSSLPSITGGDAAGVDPSVAAALPDTVDASAAALPLSPATAMPVAPAIGVGEPNEAATAQIHLESAELSDEALVRFVQTVAGERPMVAVDVQAPVLEAAQMSFDGFLVDNKLLPEVSIDLPEVVIDTADVEARRFQTDHAANVALLETSRMNLQRRAVLVRDVALDQVASLTRHLNAAPGEPLAEAFVVEDHAPAEANIDDEPVRAGDRLWLLAPKGQGEGIESRELVVDPTGTIIVDEGKIKVEGLKTRQVEEELSRTFISKLSQTDPARAIRIDAELDRARSMQTPRTTPTESQSASSLLLYHVVRVRDGDTEPMHASSKAKENHDAQAPQAEQAPDQQAATDVQQRAASRAETQGPETVQTQRLLRSSLRSRSAQQIRQQSQIASRQRVDVVVVLEGPPPMEAKEAAGASGTGGTGMVDTLKPTDVSTPRADDSPVDSNQTSKADEASKSNDPNEAKPSDGAAPAADPSPGAE